MCFLFLPWEDETHNVEKIIYVYIYDYIYNLIYIYIRKHIYMDIIFKDVGKPPMMNIMLIN